jgi:Ecdysteroid kinase-like family
VTGAVAQSFAGLGEKWFTTVLRAGGHTEAAVVTVRAEPMAFTGAVADMARFRLEYDESGRPGPGSLVAKIRGTSEIQVGMDQAMALFAREARVYADLAERIPLAMPRCYHVGDGDGTPLLLEDLGGLRIGDQVEGLTLADAERLIDVLAGMHAAFWESPLVQEDWIVSPAEGPYAQMIAQLVGSGVDAVVERFAGQVPASALDALAATAPRWGEVLERLTAGPRTLVHNDCRLDNIFFRADGEPVFVDWQIPARTRGIQDVGNLLAGSMDAEILNEHWEALVRRYHERLRSHGIDRYPWEECVLHYRQTVLYPLGAGLALLGVMKIDDERGLGDAITLRALRHAAHLDSFATV